MSQSEANRSRRNLGPYRLDQELGRGGVGEVYKAYDERLGRWVAVKRLHSDADEQARQRFRREARLLAQLRHPAIVQIFDIVEEDSGDWIVMELVNGSTLAELVRNGPFEIDLALGYARQIAAALDVAHGKGIVHRDLKTENVMVLPVGEDDSGRVKVLDFGLARPGVPGLDARSGEIANGIDSESAAALDVAISVPGQRAGTPRAMSPEQVVGDHLDGRSDLFSFGVLLHEILIGKSPFVARSSDEILRRVLLFDPPPLRTLDRRIPPALSDLVEHLLEKEPAQRPPDAATVEAKLREIADAEDLQAKARDISDIIPRPNFTSPSTIKSSTFGTTSDRMATVEGLDAEGTNDLISRAGHESFAETESEVEVAPMVSRGRELELLLSRWGMARQGRGQVVLVSGEAGIGKTRIIRAFRDALPAPTPRWWIAYGSAVLQNSPLAPLAEMLRRQVLHRGRSDKGDEAEQVARLTSFLERYDLADDEALFLFTGLLDLPFENYDPSLDPGPGARRQRLLEAAVALFLEMAEREPWVLVVEDLHWMDPSTLELLGQLIEGASMAPFFLVATSRPTGVPPWERSAALTQIHLDQLTERESSRLIDRVAEGRTLPQAIREQILARTDGVPLFVEELTKAVLETDAEDTVVIPTTLRDSLVARLERLGSAQKVAQIASTIGRGFHIDLLDAVADQGPAELKQGLEQLVEAKLIYRKGFGKNLRYLFKHALIQDVAYDSLQEEQRKALHQRIGDALTEHFADTHGAQAEIVAHHYTEAGDAARAVPYLRRAGEQALAGSAHHEALSYLERALELFETLPNDLRDTAEEVSILVSLGNCLTNSRGYTAPEVEQTWERAYSICQEGRGANFSVLFGLFKFHAVHGEFEKARADADQVLQVAKELGERHLGHQSHFLSGISHFHLGHPEDALREFERAKTFHTSEMGPDLVRAFDQDSRVTLLSYEALVLWLLGETERATERSREARDLSQDTAHPFTLSNALVVSSYLHLFGQSSEAVERCSVEIIEHSKQHGIFQVRDGEMLADLAQAIAIAQDHALELDTSALIDRLGQRLRQRATAGALIFRPAHMALLIEACLADGRKTLAANLLAETFEYTEASSERFWQPELYRLRGDLELANGEPDRARESYRKAVTVAREQSARALEERALRRLAKL